ncbi:MAG: GTP cyclohydrolase I FolE2, partial [Desulfobulbaceae bacterium]|nr:GTP cyclohydrolase I FolE2 [Desulfobulbaceae bacterium]
PERGTLNHIQSTYFLMKDIQNQPDDRRINIKKVGVKSISYPISVLDKENKIQRTVATVNMYVNLPHLFKGTHMSRFIEILNRFHGDINLRSFRFILEEMKTKLKAESAHIEIEFPYFLKKKTPFLIQSASLNILAGCMAPLTARMI